MTAQEHLSQMPSELRDRLTPDLRHFDQMTGSAKGMVLGQYHILEELGRGGYGRVYKAHHALMNRVVALKVIAPNLVDNDKVRSWFRREVIAATRLKHPNIVMAYDADEIDGVLFLVMEFVDGPNLERRIARQGPLSLASACRLMHQTALGLQYAHEQGMVHRDVKPENLLLPRTADAETGSAIVKITDFGLARLHPRTTTHNHTILNDVGGLGTPAFIAPEQAENIHAADIRSDLYSLGCTFYYALCGMLPFPGPTGMEILAQHLKREPRPLEEVRTDIPPPLAGIIRRLMRKNPDKRFQSPAELISELSFVLGPGGHWPDHGSAGAFVDLTDADNHRIASSLDESGLARQDAGVREDAAIHEIPSRSMPTPEPAKQELCSVNEEEKASPKLDACEVHAGGERSPSVPAESSEQWQGYWRQWFGMVQLLAQGEHPRVHEGNYKTLHRELLKAAKTFASCRHGVAKDRFVRLVGLVEPWLTSQSLMTLDHASLTGLQHSCEKLDRELRRAPAAFALGAWIVVLVGLVAAIAVAAWSLAHRNFHFWENFQ